MFRPRMAAWGRKSAEECSAVLARTRIAALVAVGKGAQTASCAVLHAQEGTICAKKRWNRDKRRRQTGKRTFGACSSTVRAPLRVDLAEFWGCARLRAIEAKEQGTVIGVQGEYTLQGEPILCLAVQLWPEKKGAIPSVIFLTKQVFNAHLCLSQTVS
jgi:hypothetical protein